VSQSTPAWQAQLADELRSAGATLVGFADLTDLPDTVRAGLPRAVSIGVALAPQVVQGLTAGPTPDYHAEYARVNALLGRLAAETVRTIEALGFAARTSAVTVKVVHGDGATALPHKTVATRAGLGWIGDCALLITPELGAAVRLASVLTDAPLTSGAPIDVSRCGTCSACVDACPAHAVTGTPWHAGIARDQLLDVSACKKMASSLATAQGIDVIICGICVNACPWTQRYLRRSGES
jgi:epoxyqueuosine reductase